MSSLLEDLNKLNNREELRVDNLNINYFNNLSKTKYQKYTGKELYKAYILGYIIILWDNMYTLIINEPTRITLKGIKKDLLGLEFLDSTDYHNLCKIVKLVEDNHYDNFDINRYLTQGFTNFLYNKQDKYTHITTSKLVKDKVQEQYLSMTAGLKEHTITKDNLTFTDDPVTTALINYYNDLDTCKYDSLLKSFKASLGTCIDDIVKSKAKEVLSSKDKTFIMHYVISLGIQKDNFTSSYGDNLLINLSLDFKNDQVTQYLVCGTTDNDSFPYSLSLAISKVGMYHRLFKTLCLKRLGCKPIAEEELAKYQELGYKVNNYGLVNVEGAMD